MANGFVVWEGESRLDGAPIVLIITGFSQKSLLDRFSEEDCFVERARGIRFGENSVKCLVLDPSKDERVQSLYDMCAGT